MRNLVCTAFMISSLFMLSTQVNAQSELMNAPSISAGDDLVRVMLNADGLTVRDYALLPASRSRLDLREQKFLTTGFSNSGLNEESWRMGVSPVGSFNAEDNVQSVFSLTYERIFDDIFVQHPVFTVNPDHGSMGLGTTQTVFNAQLYVNNRGGRQIAVSGDNSDATGSSRWGLYGIADGGGGGVRYGVVGQAFNTTGTRYGVLGTADPAYGYAVYASGNLAYTGSLINVSDQRLKQDVQDFSALDRVLRLRPRTYQMRTSNRHGMNLAPGQRYGFLAQELEEVFPELVSQNSFTSPTPSDFVIEADPVEYLGVETVAMIPILTRALQEQQHQMDVREKRIVDLERKNEQLESQLSRIQRRLRDIEDIVRLTTDRKLAAVR